MAARHHGDTAVAGTFVRQQQLHHRQTGVDPVGLEEVSLREVGTLHTASVQGMAFTTFVHGDEPRPVVETVPLSQNDVEVGSNAGVDE